MEHIVLDDAQLELVIHAHDRLQVRDRAGNVVGYLTPILSPQPNIDKEVIAEAQRRAASDGPWFSTKQVVEHLRSLEQR